jgi:hypothetical protein
MPANLTQPSFAAGELTPALYSRTDLQKYHIGMRTMLNWYVHAQGGASNRPGTAWVGETIDSIPSSVDSTILGRLIPFQYSTIQSYILEFGDQFMRVIKDGAYVTETPKNITAITKSSFPFLTITGHGFVSGDVIYLSGIGGMTQLNGRFVTVVVIDPNTITIYYHAVQINTTSYTTYTSGGTAARVYTLATPYVAADLPLLSMSRAPTP